MSNIYGERNDVERLFNKLKHFRRVANCYYKLLVNSMAFATIATQLR